MTKRESWGVSLNLDISEEKNLHKQLEKKYNESGAKSKKDFMMPILKNFVSEPIPISETSIKRGIKITMGDGESIEFDLDEFTSIELDKRFRKSGKSESDFIKDILLEALDRYEKEGKIPQKKQIRSNSSLPQKWEQPRKEVKQPSEAKFNVESFYCPVPRCYILKETCFQEFAEGCKITECQYHKYWTHQLEEKIIRD